METVLGGQGLVVFDSSDPAAKPLVAGLFRRELEAPGRSAALARAAGERLEAAGYHAQVTPHPDSVGLFRLDASGRRPIRRADGLFRIGDDTASAAALIEEAGAHPERFSPNVLLRPVIQDTLFPTACYVAGPNELGYLGQLREIYDRFEVPMPLVYARASATLVDSAAAKFLARYEVPFESLQPRDDAALNHLLEAHLPPSVEASFEEAAHAMRERMAGVMAAVPAIDPTLEGAARSTLGRLEHELHALRGKIIQAAKRRDDTLRRQFTRTRAQAFPGGHPQERVVGFVGFLNKYGPALVDRLLEDLPLDPTRHWIITI
jgi:bacillithiol biosynthesis cysteine-adding enzyme BshC